MNRITFRSGAEVYEDPSVPDNQYCVYVDGFPILKETIYQLEGIPNYFNAYNYMGLRAFFVNREKVRLEMVEGKTAVGALKFINQEDPEAWMICDLFEIRKKDVFYQVYQITENHETPYCRKSPRQLEIEVEERRKAAVEAITNLQKN